MGDLGCGIALFGAMVFMVATSIFGCPCGKSRVHPE